MDEPYYLWRPLRRAAEIVSVRARSAILLLAAALPARALEKSPLSLDARTDFYSAYVWRGKVLDRHAVAQPSAIATYDAQEYGAFSAKFWVNWDLSQRSTKAKATRTGGGINVFNFTPSYARTVGPVDVTVGNIFYTFPGSGYPKHSNSTYELFTTVAYKNPVVTPSLSVYYDYRDVGEGFLDDNPFKDLYIRAALDKSVPLGDRLRVGGCALVGAGTTHYNAVRYRSPNGDGLVDYQASVFLSYAVTEHFSAGATLAYTGLIGGAWGLDRSACGPDEIVWGGINLRLRF
ncbi:MAG TPA: hypothetical protein P5111_06020 [Kiritimatiellia bacterium]|nr:hypothetical protein [Kiritimatiellia bacterium]